MSCVELTVVLKDYERTYRQKFLIYDDLLMHPEAAMIQDCIMDAKKNFQGEPEDIIIKTSMTI